MRKRFSKRDIRDFLQAHPYAELFVSKKSDVVQEDHKLFVDGKVRFRRHGERWIPSLELLREQEVLPKVVVDKGAPPFILKGADLMRPGVVECDEFSKGDVVVVVDEVHGYPLATGEALLSSGELLEKDEGKVIKILHNLKSD
ncbi:RNA-binding protein [Candidatus Woesearchaeota archaeon]|nr:RNA-binding protein [Candidatus Woesearchaeota archaeon]